VAGSYPPVPGRAASLTMAAVRHALCGGAEVVVVSPRPSAAHLHAAITGARAAWTLHRLGRSVRADALVLCLEPGVPFQPGARRLRTQLEATLLVAALRRFRSVTLLICGELGVDATALRALWAVAQEVVVSSEQERDLVIRALGVPSSLVVVKPVGGRERGEILVAPARGDEPCGARSVTVAGPHEWVRGERTRNLANLAEQAASRAEHDAARAARLVLGDHASTLGRPLRRALQPLRRRVERRARGEPR
jgi:hypothetical protein